MLKYSVMEELQKIAENYLIKRSSDIRDALMNSGPALTAGAVGTAIGVHGGLKSKKPIPAKLKRAALGGGLGGLLAAFIAQASLK